MKLLAIESAALVASAALSEDGAVSAEITLNTKLTHSQTLLPIIDELFARTEWQPEDLDGIAVSAGPGSFTGLRIGAATAKALGLAWGKPLIAVPTLDAMAFSLWGSRFLICPIMDARRAQVYTGLYRFEADGTFKVLEKSAALSLEERLDGLRARGETVVFLGDGVPVFRKTIEGSLGGQALFAPSHVSRQRAAAVAALGAELLARGETVTPAAFAPFYLRISQAERERNARLRQEETTGGNA